MTATRGPYRTAKLPAYRLHKASGRAVVTLSGHDVYLGLYDTPESREKYDQVIAQYVTNGRRWPVDVPADHRFTIGELVLRYLQEHVEREYLKHGKPTSQQGNIRSALRSLLQDYARTSADAFRPQDLKRVRDRFVDRGLARSTVNRFVGLVRQFFRWAVEEEYVPAEVLGRLQSVRGLRRGKTVAPETDAVEDVSDDQIARVLPQVSRPVAAMIRLQRSTGMRPGEVVRMRLADIEVHEADGFKFWIYQPAHHKLEHHDGSTREILLSPEDWQLIQKFVTPDMSEEQYLFSPARAEAERRAAQRRTGARSGRKKSAASSPPRRCPLADHYSVASYRRAIHRACQAAGVPKWSPNRLRHTRATEVCNQHGLSHAQALLGHRSTKTTQTYLHRTDRQRQLELLRDRSVRRDAPTAS
ncbi:site-specific integrase [Maioricimonas sp. JC845]|uniref:tyrosine-type recombinase/integrase n=1 Tax=Maioricimonas sp. JC845 TaxID=3232138 RepID=UPI00345A5DFF